jgi:hypothetical protein
MSPPYPTESSGQYGRYNGQSNDYRPGVSFHALQANTGVFFIDNRQIVPVIAETVEARFIRLKSEWLQEVSDMSSLDDIVGASQYEEIISIGPPVVEFILKDLIEAPKPWFYALYIITRASPISEEIAGDMRQMSEAWIDWGRTAGYI